MTNLPRNPNDSERLPEGASPHNIGGDQDSIGQEQSDPAFQSEEHEDAKSIPRTTIEPPIERTRRTNPFTKTADRENRTRQFIGAMNDKVDENADDDETEDNSDRSEPRVMKEPPGKNRRVSWSDHAIYESRLKAGLDVDAKFYPTEGTEPVTQALETTKAFATTADSVIDEHDDGDISTLDQFDNAQCRHSNHELEDMRGCHESFKHNNPAAICEFGGCEMDTSFCTNCKFGKGENQLPKGFFVRGRYGRSDMWVCCEMCRVGIEEAMEASQMMMENMECEGPRA